MPRIHIAAADETPNPSVKRQLGKINYGLYCKHCDEFFALAVLEQPLPEPVEFISDGEPLFECPMCRQQQRRQVSEIATIVLTEEMIRRPSPPPGLN